ncbi:hypothetical protein IJG78_00285 [Candidatus Saccharibacteria bacterium]|nr:hypothetical protein [Candidatus Saccharibacteria bacterium]
MNIYISGICGTGLGPLALMAKAAGLSVCGSDSQSGAITDELISRGIEVNLGKNSQDGDFLSQKLKEGKVDWFVYTSALPSDHPELVLAKKNNIRVSKRDELIAYLVEKLGLKMVAVAGTHGKTTTTAMITWTALNIGLPVSYLVGTTLPFAEAGHYTPKSKFLIYEADEYDKNFLHFFPWLSVITAVSYDHPDIYPTKLDYMKAFYKFEGQSENVIRGRELEGEAVINTETIDLSEKFSLAGKARRYDAGLAMQAIFEMVEEIGMEKAGGNLLSLNKDYSSREIDESLLIEILDNFPGVGRRFEKIADGVYSDYGHHPEEIAATIEMAEEEAKRMGLNGVVAIYEPHQNTRQHEVRNGYKNVFLGVEKLYWLPTYLVRENEKLEVLKPSDFIKDLANSTDAEPAKLDNTFGEKLKKWRRDGYLILLMTAGPADSWLRKEFNE